MNRLIRVEFRKQIGSKSFWILLILHIAAIFLSIVNFQKFIQNVQFNVNDISEVDLSIMPLLTYPDIWQNMTYVAGFFKIILALIIITSITNEIANKTLRQNIIDGMSREGFFFSKLLLAGFLALVSTVIIFFAIYVIGTYNQDPENVTNIFEGSGFVAAYFLELLTYFIYALFVALLVKRTGLALVLLIAIDFIFEPILSIFLPDVLDGYLPMAVIDNLIRFPFTRYVGMEVETTVSAIQMIIVGLYAIFFSMAALTWLKRSDL